MADKYLTPQKKTQKAVTVVSLGDDADAEATGVVHATPIRAGKE